MQVRARATSVTEGARTHSQQRTAPNHPRISSNGRRRSAVPGVFFSSPLLNRAGGFRSGADCGALYSLPDMLNSGLHFGQAPERGLRLFYSPHGCHLAPNPTTINVDAFCVNNGSISRCLSPPFTFTLPSAGSVMNSLYRRQLFRPRFVVE